MADGVLGKGVGGRVEEASAIHSAWAEPWRSECFTGGNSDGEKEPQRQPVQWCREQPDVSATSPRLGQSRE